jgi:hypothetical protein
MRICSASGSTYAVNHGWGGFGAVGFESYPATALQARRAVEGGGFVDALRAHRLEAAPDFAVPVFPQNIEMLGRGRRQFPFDLDPARAGQRQQRWMRQIDRVRRVDQLRLFERLERQSRQQRRAVIDILVAARPQADHLRELRSRDAGGALGFKDDLLRTWGRRWRGEHRARRGRKIGGGCAELKHDRCARRLGRDQPDAQQIEKCQLLLVGRAVQPLHDRLQIARDDLHDRPIRPLRRGRPVRHVAGPSRQQRGGELGGFARIEFGCRCGYHAAVPSWR